MMKLVSADLPTFNLFSRGYWGQMGPDVYGTFDAALQQYALDARKTCDPADHFTKLLIELQEVRRRGSALKLDGVESPEVWDFWRGAGGRGLSASEFDYAEEFLRRQLNQ